jgi:hypothetical protein
MTGTHTVLTSDAADSTWMLWSSDGGCAFASVSPYTGSPAWSIG